LKTIEPMEVHRGSGTMCNTKTSKAISRTDPMILNKCSLDKIIFVYLQNETCSDNHIIIVWSKP